MLPPREDDLELDFIRLNLAAMKTHHYITYDSTYDLGYYLALIWITLAL